jgi:hypothetical protein
VLTSDIMNPTLPLAEDIQLLLRVLDSPNTEQAMKNRERIKPGAGFVELAIYPLSVDESSYRLEGHLTKSPEFTDDDQSTVSLSAVSTSGDSIHMILGIPELKATASNTSFIPDTPESRELLDEALVSCYITHALEAYSETEPDAFNERLDKSRRAWELLQMVRKEGST